MDALGTQDSPRVSRSARRLRGPTRATAPRHPSCLTIKQGAPCQLPVKLAPVSLSASQELPPSRSADEDSRERAAAHATVPAPRPEPCCIRHVCVTVSRAHVWVPKTRCHTGQRYSLRGHLLGVSSEVKPTPGCRLHGLAPCAQEKHSVHTRTCKRLHQVNRQLLYALYIKWGPIKMYSWRHTP